MVDSRSRVREFRFATACTPNQEELERALGILETGESPEFVAMDLRAALDSIGDVIGKTDVEEILGEIFSTFCIGK